MKSKKRKLFNKIALITPSFLLTPFVVSCSSNDEFANLQNEMKQMLVQNYQELVEIVWEDENKVFENVDDIFNSNISSSPFLLKTTTKWNEWNEKIENNNNLTDKEKKRLKFTKNSIINITIPSLSSREQEIEKIKVIIDLSNGPVINNIIEHEFVLDSQHVKNKKIINNNFNDINLNNLVTQKQLIQKEIEEKVSTLGEINNDVLEKEPKKLNFNIEKKYEKHIYQDNIKTFFDKDTMTISNNTISEMIVYFSDSSKSTKKEIMDSSIYYVLKGIEIKK